MKELFDRFEREGLLFLQIEGTSRFVEKQFGKEPDGGTRLLFDVLQAHVVEATKLFAIDNATDRFDRVRGRPARSVQKFITRWDTQYSFGEFSDIGEIEVRFGEGFARFRFDYASFEPSSVKGKFKAAIVTGALTVLTIGPEAVTRQFQHVDDIQRTKCATDISVQLTYSDYFRTLWTGLTELQIPMDEAAAKVRKSAPPVREVCLLQYAIGRSHYTHERSRLEADGKFGRQTYYEWQLFKKSTGAKTDQEALNLIVRDMRLELNVVGAILHQVRK